MIEAEVAAERERCLKIADHVYERARCEAQIEHENGSYKTATLATGSAIAASQIAKEIEGKVVP
jgi:hypothetical protein